MRSATITSIRVNASRFYGPSRPSDGPVEQGDEIHAGAVADGYPIENRVRPLHIDLVRSDVASSKPQVEIDSGQQAIGGKQTVLVRYVDLAGLGSVLASRQLAEQADGTHCGKGEDCQSRQDFEQERPAPAAHHIPGRTL